MSVIADTYSTKPKLDTRRLRELSVLQPGLGLALIGMELVAAITAAVLCWQHFHPALYLLAIAFIGARQHSLGVMVHEGAHYRLARNKELNDWLSELLCAWPLLFISTRAYRRNHNAHHRHLNTERDPDLARKQGPAWQFPKPARHIAGYLIGTALGGGLIRSILLFKNIEPSKRPTNERRFVIGRVVFLVTLATTLTLTGTWAPFLAMWLVPLVTWALVAQEIRSISEHHGIPDGPGVYAGTRTTIPTIFDRLFVASHGVQFHMEHHLYPSVPIYKLRALHEALCEDPVYAANLHVSRGHHRALLECVG